MIINNYLTGHNFIGGMTQTWTWLMKNDIHVCLLYDISFRLFFFLNRTRHLQEFPEAKKR